MTACNQTQTDEEQKIESLNNYITLNVKDQQEPIKVTSFHVSCKSDPCKGNEDMTGIILYQRNGKTKWTCNKIRCRSGYIYIRNNKDLKCEENESMYVKCYKTLFGIDSDYKTIIATGIKFNKTKQEWTTSESAIKLLNKTKENDGDGKTNENEKIWFDILFNLWRKSDYKKQTIQVQGTVWSWFKKYWMHYDVDTSKYIETEFMDFHLKNVEDISSEVSIKLTDAKNKSTIFNNPQNGKKYYDKYEIYFKTSKIHLDASKIHSQQNPRWKNDKDGRNSYYLQKNYEKNKYRIVRRRIMS